MILKKEKKRRKEVEVGENTAVPGWLAHLHHHLCADQQQQLHQRLTSLAWGPGRWCPGCAGGPRPEPALPGRTSRPPPWTSPAHSVKAIGSEHQSGWPYTENCTGHRHWHTSVSLRKGTFVGLASSLPFHPPHGHFNLPRSVQLTLMQKYMTKAQRHRKKKKRKKANIQKSNGIRQWLGSYIKQKTNYPPPFHLLCTQTPSKRPFTTSVTHLAMHEQISSDKVYNPNSSNWKYKFNSSISSKSFTDHSMSKITPKRSITETLRFRVPPPWPGHPTYMALHCIH